MPHSKSRKNKNIAAGRCICAGIRRHDFTLGDQIQHRPLHLRQHVPLCLGLAQIPDMVVIDEQNVTSEKFEDFDGERWVTLNDE
jgi:hypothetical protein